MEKMRRRFFAVLCVCCLSFVAVSAAWAAEGKAQSKTGKMLATAWDEYGFQNWEKANNLFLGVISEDGVSGKHVLQARIGLAMVKQYRAPGRQPEEAIEDYKLILKDLGELHESRSFVLFNIGYACITKDKPDYKQARDYYQKSLDSLTDKKSFLGQQIVLRYLASYLMRPDKAQFLEGIEKSKKLIPLIEGGDFEGIAYGLVAALARCVDDCQLEVDCLKKQYSLGIKNRSILSATIFKIANISDRVLKNYPDAIKYYRILAKDVPTSTQGYYSKLRALEIEKGVYKSRIVGSKDFSYLGLPAGDPLPEIPLVDTTEQSTPAQPVKQDK